MAIEKMTAELVKERYPEVYSELTTQSFQDGVVKGSDKAYAKGREEGLEEGKRLERERIKAVEAMAMPGHEKLIETMKFDGKTEGSEAAVKILQAEKGRMATMMDDRRKDGKHIATDPAIRGAEEETVEKPQEKFMDKVEKYKAEHNCKMSVAVKRIAIAFPVLHAEYIKETNA